MHIDRAVTDNRMARDWFSIAARSPLPFGSGYRSSLQPIGSAAYSTGEVRLFPSLLLGQPIVYGETTVAAASAFPTGLTQIYRPRIGSNPLPANVTSIVPVGCAATLNPSPSNGPKAIVTSVSSNPSLNVSSGQPLPTDVVALEMAGDCCGCLGPWVQRGLPGYSIASLADRPLVAGEVKLSGSSPCIVTSTLAPTFPDVLLFLWFTLFGSVDGLDLASVEAMATRNRSLGLLWNGDVMPDRLEAWIYQASHSHGLRVERSRDGIRLAPMGKPTLIPTARLLTGVNSRDIVRTWEHRNSNPKVRYGLASSTTKCCGESVISTDITIVMPSRTEELLGVRATDAAHIATVARLWAEERSLVTRYSMEIATHIVSLALDDVLAISDSTAPGQWQGYAKAQTAMGVQGSWDGSIISGKSDGVTASSLTDASKVFTRAAIGDTLELAIAGSIVATKVTAIAGSTVSFSPSLSIVPVAVSYRIMQTSGGAVVSWQMKGQPIVQATVTPAYNPEVRSVVYPLPTTLPVGTPVAVGALELARVGRIDGAIVWAVG